MDYILIVSFGAACVYGIRWCWRTPEIEKDYVETRATFPAWLNDPFTHEEI